MTTITAKSTSLRPLTRARILSLALNLPGPAALMRCKAMGATCVKLEPPQGDPMGHYNPQAYADMHKGVRVACADLKTEAGQKMLHHELAKADVLITSFRPSALQKLGLGWRPLRKRYPALSQIAIVGSPGARAEEPGHDLTYLAENDLVTGLDLPATLYADISGSLMASEAVLQAVMNLRNTGNGVFIEIALSNAASYLALPRTWGLSKLGAAVGGGHAGYQVYRCRDGRVAVAALEPHFALRLCDAVGLQTPASQATQNMNKPATQLVIAAWMLTKTRKQLAQIALDKDIPLHAMV